MCFTERFLSLIDEKENEAVKWILEDCRIYHSIVDAKGSTLLHYAVQHRNSQLVKYLLDNGCQIDAQNSAGRSPLILAVKHDDYGIVRMLLDADADIHVKDKSGKTALNYALNQNLKVGILWPLFHVLMYKENGRFNSDEIAKMLINDNCPLNRAAFTRDSKVIKYMLEKGVPIVKDPTEPNYVPALHVAVGLHDVDTVKLLLKQGADIDELGFSGTSALFHSFNWRLINNEDRDGLEVLKILLNAGISITSCIKGGMFNISRLLLQSNCQIIRLLLESNVNVNAKDNCKRRTILHYLARNNNPGIIDQLKCHSAKFNVNILDNTGKSPLDHAVFFGNVALTKLLLDCGAPANINAIWYAYLSSNPSLKDQCYECAQLLFQYNANAQVIFETKTQKTIFDLAAENKHFDRINLAIAHLALLEKQGVMITELIASKIDSQLQFKTYYEKCQGVLRKKIHANVSFFQMLTSDQRKLAKYLNNDKLVRKFMRIAHKQNLITFYKYYYNILKRRFSQGFRYKALRHKAAEITYDISGERLGPTHVATEKVIDYLSDQDLRKLYYL